MAEPKRRTIASECRKFQTRWKDEYFFIETKGKCVCLICNETVAADGAPAMKGDSKGIASMVCAKVRNEAVYLTSSEWPSLLNIFLYVALRKKSLDTPGLHEKYVRSRFM
ncbi:Uncharacterised protein r2_g544 [Pycnogonum litorale]